jgi:hypothetical protein
MWIQPVDNPAKVCKSLPYDGYPGLSCVSLALVGVEQCKGLRFGFCVTRDIRFNPRSAVHNPLVNQLLLEVESCPLNV